MTTLITAAKETTVQPMYIVSSLKSGVHKIFQRIPITLDFYK